MTDSDPTPAFEGRFQAQASSLREIRGAVHSTCEDLGVAEACAHDVVLAVDEACQNIIRHAYSGESGEILVRIARKDADLVINLIDFAPEIDPASIRPRDLDDVKPGGLGTHLIAEIMDRVEFVDAPPDCGNMLLMVKRIE